MEVHNRPSTSMTAGGSTVGRKPVERQVKDGSPQAALDPEQERLAGLVAEIARRDQQALTAFYDATVGRVYGLARRIARNEQAAEEIAADVYVQVWHDAPRYDPARSKVLTWLLMMCRSRALDHLRALEPAFAHEDPDCLRREEDRACADDPLDLLLAVRRDGDIHAALGKLSPLQRQLLGLAFFRGLTHQEIAAQAQLPLGTVKSGIRRALEAMRQKLSD